jgi:hypothetical protein
LSCFPDIRTRLTKSDVYIIADTRIKFSKKYR